MELSILGLGTALPSNAVSQATAADVARQLAREKGLSVSALDVLYGRSGIATRHSVLAPERVLEWSRASNGSPAESGAAGMGPTTEERMTHYVEHAPPLAIRAVEAALGRAGIEARELTHLVTVSCTGFSAPGFDLDLIRALAMRPTVERVHVGFMGCHGAINGLRVVQALAGTSPEASVLLCAVELCSLHYYYGPERRKQVGNALFSDGAAALVGMGRAPGGAMPQRTGWRLAATGSCVLPESEADMSWVIGDHGFEMALSTRVPALIREHLRPWLEAWIEERGLTLGGVASWAVHPGGPRIVSAVEQSLGLEPGATAASREVLSECGNMSSPTILFILDRLMARRSPLPCVALGFGPGLAAEAALFVGSR